MVLPMKTLKQQNNWFNPQILWLLQSIRATECSEKTAWRSNLQNTVIWL